MTDKVGKKPGNKATHKPGNPSRATAQTQAQAHAHAQRLPPLKGAADSLSTERVFGALANGSRRDVLAILEGSHGRMTSGEIAGHFDSSWQTVSRHLKVLEEAGLISFERRGRDRAYKIETARLHTALAQWLMRFGGADRSPAEATATKE